MRVPTYLMMDIRKLRMMPSIMFLPSPNLAARRGAVSSRPAAGEVGGGEARGTLRRRAARRCTTQSETSEPGM